MHNDKNSRKVIHSESHNDTVALKLIASKTQVNFIIFYFCSLLETFRTMSKQLMLLTFSMFIYVYMNNFNYASIQLI